MPTKEELDSYLRHYRGEDGFDYYRGDYYNFGITNDGNVYFIRVLSDVESVNVSTLYIYVKHSRRVVFSEKIDNVANIVEAEKIIYAEIVNRGARPLETYILKN